MTPRVPIFVCGEPARGDDAAGFAAVELLPPGLLDRVDVVAAGQLDLLLLLDLPAGSPCVVVDAVAGLRPGEVWVRPLATLVDRARAAGSGGPAAGSGGRGPGNGGRGPGNGGRGPEPRSSHELPLEQVLALAATLREAPPAGTFVGIGGSCWDVGAGLTPAVAAALPAFAAAIAAAVDELSGGLTPAG